MIDEVDCIQGIREAADELGKSPTKSEYEALDISPSSTSILRIMGSWNKAKEAAGLETYTQSEGGGVPIQPKPAGVTIPSDQDWEDLTPQQRWYYKNRDYRMEVKTRRKKALRRWFYEYKRNRFECNNCAEGFPGCLDFHHVETKRNDLSKLVAHGYSKESIKQEIQRCVVLCANCHHKKHLESSVTMPSGTNSERFVENSFPSTNTTATSKQEHRAELRKWLNTYQVKMGGCSRCPEDDPRCLDFHHVQPDTESVSFSKLIAVNASRDRFMREIEKCEILCRNCHRKEHYEIPKPLG